MSAASKRLSARLIFDEANVKFKQYKVLITDRVHPICADTLRKAGLKVTVKHGATIEELEELLPKFDGWIVSDTKVTAELLSYATQMRFIARAVAGLENIDLKAATRRGIAVMDTPGGHVVSAVEHVLGLLLCLSHGVKSLWEYDDDAGNEEDDMEEDKEEGEERKGESEIGCPAEERDMERDGAEEEEVESKDGVASEAGGVAKSSRGIDDVESDSQKYRVGNDLYGRTVAIWGIGVMAREIASRCLGLGMRVRMYDHSMKGEEVYMKDELERFGISLYPSQQQLCQNADFLVVSQLLHPPSSTSSDNETGDNDAETPRRPMIKVVGSKAFSYLASQASVVITPRSCPVDASALEDALNSGKVRGVAVGNGEWCSATEVQSVLQHKHCIVAPLSGSSTAEAEEKLAHEVAGQIISAFSGDIGNGLANAMLHGLTQDLIPYVEIADVLGSLTSQIMEGQLVDIKVRCYGDLFMAEKDNHSVRKAFKAALLRGILSDSLLESVNYVNAPHIARCLGMKVMVTAGSIDDLGVQMGVWSTPPTPHKYRSGTGSARNSIVEGEGGSEGREGKARKKTFLSYRSPLPSSFMSSLYSNLVVVDAETTIGHVVVSGTVSSQGEALITSITGYPVEIVPEGAMLLYWSEDKPGMLHEVANVLCANGAGIVSLVVGRSDEQEGYGLGPFSPPPPALQRGVSFSSALRALDMRSDAEEEEEEGEGGKRARREEREEKELKTQFVSSMDEYEKIVLTAVNVATSPSSHDNIVSGLSRIPGMKRAVVVKLPNLRA